MTYPCLRAVVGALGLVTALGVTGCGLISSDVTDFDLTLPPKKFTIDAGHWNIDQAKANTYLDTSCASNNQLCSSVAQNACSAGCTGTCNAVQKCDLVLDVSLSKSVDLVAEKPELKSINDQPVIKVTIDSVTYDVSHNDLNVATPELKVYVAPISVAKPTDASNPGKLIGTIPPIPAGHTTTTRQALVFTAGGKAELVNIMSSFKTPFNVWVAASLLVTSGQPVPSGMLESSVYIQGHAGL